MLLFLYYLYLRMLQSYEYFTTFADEIIKNKEDNEQYRLFIRFGWSHY